MDRSEHVIVVTGATGQQGGATARQLLADGWRVRAFVRDPGRARDLADAGAELVVGDMGDPDSLRAAADGAYGMFSVQPAAMAPHFDTDEVRFGVNVADAAQAAGVRHFVYASVGGAERGSGISHWDTKWRIEQHIRELGLPATVLRPVMFMENHTSPVFGVTGPAALIRMIPGDAHVQLIAVRDIGAFAALAFANPGYYLGKALELAGDQLSRDELVTAVSEATGHVLDTTPLPADVLGQVGSDPEDLTRARSFGGWQADIPLLRSLHPGLMGFRTWLAGDGLPKFTSLFAGQPA